MTVLMAMGGGGGSVEEGCRAVFQPCLRSCRLRNLRGFVRASCEGIL